MSTDIPITNKGPRLDEKRVLAFEGKLRDRLPDDFRAFLLAVNGGEPPCEVVAPDGHDGTLLNVFFGIGQPKKYAYRDVEQVIENMQLRDRGHYPPEAVPFGDDEFGNLFVIAVGGPRHGEVFFQALDVHPDRRHDTEWYRTRQFKRIAGSFTEFLAMLKPDEDEE
jgi:hypothetical protein